MMLPSCCQHLIDWSLLRTVQNVLLFAFLAGPSLQRPAPVNLDWPISAGSLPVSAYFSGPAEYVEAAQAGSLEYNPLYPPEEEDLGAVVRPYRTASALQTHPRADQEPMIVPHFSDRPSAFSEEDFRVASLMQPASWPAYDQASHGSASSNMPRESWHQLSGSNLNGEGSIAPSLIISPPSQHGLSHSTLNIDAFLRSSSNPSTMRNPSNVDRKIKQLSDENAASQGLSYQRFQPSAHHPKLKLNIQAMLQSGFSSPSTASGYPANAYQRKQKANSILLTGSETGAQSRAIAEPSTPLSTSWSHHQPSVFATPVSRSAVQHAKEGHEEIFLPSNRAAPTYAGSRSGRAPLKFTGYLLGKPDSVLARYKDGHPSVILAGDDFRKDFLAEFKADLDGAFRSLGVSDIPPNFEPSWYSLKTTISQWSSTRTYNKKLALTGAGPRGKKRDKMLDNFLAGLGISNPYQDRTYGRYTIDLTQARKIIRTGSGWNLFKVVARPAAKDVQAPHYFLGFLQIPDALRPRSLLRLAQEKAMGISKPNPSNSI